MIDKLKNALNRLKELGADEVGVSYASQGVKELYCNHEGVNLFRTTNDIDLTFTAIVDKKKGSISINKSDEESISRAIYQTIEIAKSSEVDEANVLPEEVNKESYSYGPLEADDELMYERLVDFLGSIKKEYPLIHLEEGGVKHKTGSSIYINSNGVELSKTSGVYELGFMFNAKDGQNTSSINWFGNLDDGLERAFLEYENVSRVLEQTERQVDPKKLGDKFVGDIIITPEVLPEIISTVTAHLGDYNYINNNSLLRSKMDEKVFHESLTVKSNPRDDRYKSRSLYSGVGLPTKNINIIKDGVVKNSLLSWYGCKKCNVSYSGSTGANLEVLSGEESLEEMIRGVDRGLLLCRFSGGRPNDNGDFSGVAKNSFYIEGGKIQYVVKEVSISGNCFDLLKDVKAISKDRVDNGYAIMPWLKTGNVTISG